MYEVGIVWLSDKKESYYIGTNSHEMVVGKEFKFVQIQNARHILQMIIKYCGVDRCHKLIELAISNDAPTRSN